MSIRTFSLPSSVIATLLVALAFALGFAEFVLIGIVPAVSTGLNAPLTLVGDLVGFYALACAVATPFVTLAAGRVKRFSLLIVLLVLFSFGNLLTLFAASYPVLLVSRMIAASTSGALLSIALTFVPDIVDKRRVTRVLSCVLAGFSVSSVFGVPIGTALAGAFGWKAAYVAVFVFGLIVSVPLVLSLPRTGSVDTPATVREQVRLLGDTRVLANIAMILCGAASTYVFYTYLTPVLESIMGVPAWGVGVILLAFGAASVLSNLVSGIVAQRFGAKGLFVAFMVHAGLLALLAVSTVNMIAGITNILAVGVAMYVMNSTVQMLFLDIANKDYPGAVTFSSSMHPMSFNAGIALGSFVGGFVVNTAGLEATGPVGALFAVAAAGLSLVLVRALKAQKAQRVHSVV